MTAAPWLAPDGRIITDTWQLSYVELKTDEASIIVRARNDWHLSIEKAPGTASFALFFDFGASLEILKRANRNKSTVKVKIYRVLELPPRTANVFRFDATVRELDVNRVLFDCTTAIALNWDAYVPLPPISEDNFDDE